MAENKIFECEPCKFSAKGVQLYINHLHSGLHKQNGNICNYDVIIQFVDAYNIVMAERNYWHDQFRHVFKMYNESEGLREELCAKNTIIERDRFNLEEKVEELQETIKELGSLPTKFKNLSKSIEDKPTCKPISKLLKQSVWDTYVGEDVTITKCSFCNKTKILSDHFECGHIISNKNGGETIIDNLRPICELCNKSIGSQNMEDFKKTLKKHKKMKTENLKVV
jgi:5-methylcytosine-specific restriction endonuclease McrA